MSAFAFASAIALAVPVGDAAAASPTAPAISANPGTPQTGGAAAAGATVTVTGSGFGAGETIALSLNSQSLTTTPSPLVAASDGTFSGTFVTPGLAVREYPLVALGQSSGARASMPFWLKAVAENVYSPTSSNSTYQITDTDPREPLMQYLRITNTGAATLVAPKILPDTLPGQDAIVDLSSLPALVNGILAANPNATTDAQKALAIWQWVTNYTYHWYDAQNPNIQNQPDVLGLMNNYGYMRCFNHARLLADLFQQAGYNTRTWNLNGHAVPEVYYGGAWHMYDADEEMFLVGSDGSTVLGEQDLAANPHPISLNTNPGGVAFHYAAPYLANLYATTSDTQPLGNVYPPATHPMGVNLRQNETLMQYWSNIGKYHDNYLHTTPPVYTNGDLLYVPDLSQASYKNGVFSQSNVSSFAKDGLHPDLHAATTGTTSSVIYQMSSPYTLVGSLLSAQTYRASSADSLSIYFSLDGVNWGSPIYTQTKLGYDNPVLDLSSSLNDGTLPEEYQYYIMFQWTASSGPEAVGVDNFSVDSQFEQTWEAVPPLHSGTTKIAYSDQNGVSSYASGTIQVAYGWTPQSTPASVSTSSLVTDYTSVPANGVTFANITLTLKTASKAKVGGMFVQLIPSGTGASPVQIERTYDNQGLRGQTDSSGRATWEVRSRQMGTVTLTAADKNGVSLGLPPITLTFTTPPPVPTLTTSEGTQVVNGGFETGDLTGWTAGGDIAPTVESTTIYSGSDAAQLGNTTPSGAATDSWLVETLSVPTGTRSLSLAYQLANTNADSQNTLEIWMRDTSGDKLSSSNSNPPVALFHTSASTSGWSTLNLTYLNKYAGNTIQIYIVLHQDGSSNPASAYLDAIQLK